MTTEHRREGLVFNTTLRNRKLMEERKADLEAFLDIYPAQKHKERLADLGWLPHEYRYQGRELLTINGSWVLVRRGHTFELLAEHLVTCEDFKTFVEAAIPGLTVSVTETFMGMRLVAGTSYAINRHMDLAATFEANTGAKFDCPSEFFKKIDKILYHLSFTDDRRLVIVAQPADAKLVS